MEMKSGNEGIEYTIRKDFDIDRDVRVFRYDEYLLNTGFKYVHTLMGSTGGIRIYTNNKVIVGVFRRPEENELWWYIDKVVTNKPLYQGNGISRLMLRFK